MKRENRSSILARPPAAHLLAARTALLALLALPAPLALGAQQELRAPRAEDFVDIREASDARISPDGATVLFRLVEPRAGEAGRGGSAVWVVATRGGEEPRRVVTRAGALDPAWGPDGRSISFLAAADGGGGRQVFLQSVDGGEPVQLTRLEGGVSRYAWSPGGSALAVVTPRRGGSLPATADDEDAIAPASQALAERTYNQLQVVELDGGAVRPASPEGWNVKMMVWSPDGREIAVVASGAGRPRDAVAVVARDGSAHRVLAGNAGGPGTRRQVLDWSPDGRTIVFAHVAPARQVGHWLGLVPAAGGEVRQLLREYPGTVMRAFWAPDSRHILAQSFEGLTSRVIRVNAASGTHQQLAELHASYPQLSASRDGRRFAYLSEDFHSPADVWALESGRQPRRLTRLNPQLAGVRFGDVRAVEWRSSRDGTLLQGVLVTPPGFTPGAHPTVVQLHGGPHFHWGLGWLGSWHDWAQWLAGRGYVVFMPNPRGSTGRGWDFAGAIVDDLGGVDLQDVLDGVDAIVASGVADPDRLGVGGWSYGGFLTAWTVTQTPRFRAAVMGAGISNLFSFAGTPGLGRSWSTSFFAANPYRQRELYERRSPTSYLHQVVTPTLVVHGERDSKISVTQAWEFHTGLNVLGVGSEILVFPRAGHGLSDRADRLEYLNRVAEWYDRHLAGGAR